MIAQRYPHKIVLLTTGFRRPDQRGFFRRARLFPDRIELSGWYLGERFEEQLYLDQVDRVEWSPQAMTGPNVVFHLHDGRSMALHLDRARRWRHLLEDRLQWHASPARRRAAAPRTDLPLRDLVAYSSGLG